MDVNIEEARLTFETNFFAVIRICQTFLPLLMKSKGTIVQIGSVAGVSSLRESSLSTTSTDVSR
jgi:1-acylglycerone phosphate reductase